LFQKLIQLLSDLLACNITRLASTGNRISFEDWHDLRAPCATLDHQSRGQATGKEGEHRRLWAERLIDVFSLEEVLEGSVRLWLSSLKGHEYATHLVVLAKSQLFGERVVP
jgi:hypothetical protein